MTKVLVVLLMMTAIKVYGHTFTACEEYPDSPACRLHVTAAAVAHSAPRLERPTTHTALAIDRTNVSRDETVPYHHRVAVKVGNTTHIEYRFTGYGPPRSKTHENKSGTMVPSHASAAVHANVDAVNAEASEEHFAGQRISTVVQESGGNADLNREVPDGQDIAITAEPINDPVNVELHSEH